MPDDSNFDDPDAIWARVRSELERSLPAATFDLWIDPLRAAGAQAETLYLTGPDRVRMWVERRYLEPLNEALRRVESEFQRIAFIDRRDRNEPTERERRDTVKSVVVDEKHDFDRFVIGPGSRFAHAAALAVAEAPGEAYNPLFLHGPPGLGKTHLLGAIATYLRQHHPELTVHYTTAEQFTTEFVTALRKQGPERFKERYRNLDALLIDDVQFLEGKKKTEEEFVHTFNALFSAGKQIVMTSDRPPGALAHLEDRLRDRLTWGLTVEMDPPDLPTKVALVWRFAGDALDSLLDPALLRDIAARAPGNVRELEGAFTRVLARSSIYDEPLIAATIARVLGGEQSRFESAGSSIVAPTVSAIQDAVSAVLGIPKSDLLSGKRAPAVARARQMAMFLARELTPLSLAQIAREFDRDHSTVVHAVRVVGKRNEPGSETAGDINNVRLILGRLALDRGENDEPLHDPESRPHP